MSIKDLKISIITVVKNNKALLKDAIDSVLSQDYPFIEYIIVDGGSEDGSYEIVKSFEGRISTVISEPDKGIYDAMNKGIELATGDVIGFLNSDDFYTSNKVISTVADFFNKKKVDAVYGDLDYVYLTDKNKIVRKWRSGVYTQRYFLMGWMPPHPTFFVKKEIYLKHGGYNQSLNFSADYELMLRLLYLHQVAVEYIPNVLVKMRVGGQSNRSLGNRIRAHFEDYKAWEINHIKPRIFTLWLKPIRKLIQYII